MNETKSWLWLGVGTLLLVGVILVADQSGTTTPGERSDQQSTILAPDPDDWRLGPADAAVTLIEYGDFQCPACASYAPIVKELAARFPNDLKILFRHFPLAQHREAQTAARAAEAAGLQGQFWPMVDLLYARQSDWAGTSEAADMFLAYAREINLDEKRFHRDRTSDEVAKRIRVDLDESRDLGLTSTPTFFLDNILIDNRDVQSLDQFVTLIQIALDQKAADE